MEPPAFLFCGFSPKCPFHQFPGALAFSIRHSLCSPQGRWSANSAQGLGLCWPQHPQTKLQAASPSRPPHADTAAYRSSAPTPRAGSSCGASHPCHPIFSAQRESGSSLPQSHVLLYASSTWMQTWPSALPSSPSLNTPSIQNKTPTLVLIGDLGEKGVWSVMVSL